jgi:ComF family protein
MWELKYYRNGRAAAFGSEILSDLLLDCAQEALGTPLLIPIPMHESRRKERGFNQTEVLCARTLKHTDEFFTYSPDALVRMRNTPRQQGLTREARLRNIEGSMWADAKAVRGRTCVVVDDVTTTGATFAEAKRALLAEGASSVLCVALARS